jgi:hypothetical protein
VTSVVRMPSPSCRAHRLAAALGAAPVLQPRASVSRLLDKKSTREPGRFAHVEGTPAPRWIGPSVELSRSPRPPQKAGALVVLVGGDVVLYVERGGRTLLSFVDDPEALIAAGQALAAAVRSGALGVMSVERADGESVHSSPLRDALTKAGFRATPRGLRLRG